MRKLKEIFENLEVNEIEEIYKLISSEMKTFDVGFELEEEEIIEDENGKTLKSKRVKIARLRGSIKRNCYIAYAKYKYQAEVTVDGKPYAVDTIRAEMNSGNGLFKKKVANSSILKKTDEVFEYGNACRSASMVAVAKKGNGVGRVRVKLK